MKDLLVKSWGDFRTRLDLHYLFVVALVLRFGYLALMMGQVSHNDLLNLAPDTIRYINVGKGIAGMGAGDGDAVMLFGPGYGSFLGILFWLCGISPYPVLIFQIILSSLGCLLLYKLGKELTNSRGVGLIAGYLAAFSFTSISLATFMLSDCLFYFLFLAGNLLFLGGQRKANGRYLAGAGIFIAAAALVRPIGQFWPLVMVLLILILHPYRSHGAWGPTQRRMLRKVMIAPGIALLIMGGWIAHNYGHYGIPAFAYSSAGGPAKVAAIAMGRMQNKDETQIRSEWLDQYKKATGDTDITIANEFRSQTEGARRTLRHYPGEVLRAYKDLIWENLTDENELYRAQLPLFLNFILDKMETLRDLSLNQRGFWLAISGFLLLLVMRKWRALAALTAIYLYFVLMIGFSRWQGSRLFYPGQIAALIATAYLIWLPLSASWRLIRNGLRPLKRRLASWPVYDQIKERAAAFGASLMVFPHKKAFSFLYGIGLIIGIIFLYRAFIFSGKMLLSADVIDMGLFFRSFLIKSVCLQGHIPGWDPYMFCGLPFVDAIHGDIFYPLSFLKFIISIPRAVGWTFIGHIFLAGIGAYLAAREMGLSRTAAAVAGMSYAFSGWLNSLVLPGHDSKIYVTALFPFLILFLQRAIKRQTFRYYTLSGIVLGCIVLSPHPQMAMFSLAGFVAYALYLLAAYRPPSGKTGFFARHAALIMYSLVLGMMLGAIQFLPTWVYVRHDSPRTYYTHEYYYRIFASSWAMHPEETLSLAVPEFTGINLPDSARAYWGRNNHKDNSEYAGLVALVLGIIGIIYSKHKEKYFFTALAALSLLYALGYHTAFFHLVYTYIPLIRLARAPSMDMFLFSCAVSMLAAFGTDVLISRHAEDRSKRYVIVRLLLCAILVILVLGAVLFAFLGKEVLSTYANLLYPDLATNTDKMEWAVTNLPRMVSGSIIAAVLTAIMLMIVSLSSRRFIGFALMLSLPLLVAADGIRFDRQFIRVVDAEEKLLPAPETAFMKANVGLFRVQGFALNETAWQLAYHEIPDPLGYHGNEPAWYFRFTSGGDGVEKNFINPRFTNLVGVKYILAPTDAELESIGYGSDELIEVYRHEKFKVMENRRCFPRAYLVGSYEVNADTDSMWRVVYHGTSDLRRMVYLEAEPPEQIDSTISPQDSAEIRYYSPDSILITAQCRTAKLLTLSDTYYKDWHVFINGREKPVIRTYGVFRGVVVEPGASLVVWKYIPSTYHTGMIITFLALGFLLIALPVDYAVERRRLSRPGLKPTIGKQQDSDRIIRP